MFIMGLKNMAVDNGLSERLWKRVKAIHASYIDRYFIDLETANTVRQIEWDTDDQIGPLFRAVEFGGEVGEILNVVKKLEREKMGIAGSRDTLEHLGEEIADGFISLTLLAQQYNIDIDQVIAKKFNGTSKANGLNTRMLIPL